MGKILKPGSKNLAAKKQSESQPDYSGISVLHNNENGLKRYNSQIVRMMHKGFPTITHKDSILEFGAGTGTLAIEWQQTYGIKADCLEIDAELLSTLSKRGFKTFSTLDEAKQDYKYIYTSNVLEHIEDDLSTLQDLDKHLSAGGKIAIYVPAFPLLFSELDSSVGHFRRYQRRELIDKVNQSGFKVMRCVYSDSVGFVASILIKIVGFNTDTGLGSNRALKFYDKYCYPISLALDAMGLKYFFGKNLFLIAEK